MPTQKKGREKKEKVLQLLTSTKCSRPTYLNASNAYMWSTLEGAFAGGENSTTNWMVPHVKKDVIHPVTNFHVSGRL